MTLRIVVGILSLIGLFVGFVALFAVNSVDPPRGSLCPWDVGPCERGDGCAADGKRPCEGEA